MRFSYGSTCSFTCGPGYILAGPSAVTCTSAAEWNEPMPRCEGKFLPTAFCVAFIVDVFYFLESVLNESHFVLPLL